MTDERTSINTTAEQPSPSTMLADKLLNWSWSEGNLNSNYAALTDIETKIRVAEALIEDGRYAQDNDPKFLLKNFIPQPMFLDSLDSSATRFLHEQAIQEKGDEYKDRLLLLLVEKGHIAPKTKEDDDAIKVVERRLSTSQTMDLVEAGGTPEVVGQIMTLELFSNVSDATKIEELRGWVTRALLRPYIGILTGTTPPRNDLSVVDMLDRIPERIFTDLNIVRFNLVQHYLEERLSRMVTDMGLEGGIEEMERMIAQSTEPGKRAFLQATYDRFYDIATQPASPQFKREILVKGKPRQFPSFEQMTFKYDYKNHNTRLCTAGTGLGKSNAAFLTIESSDGQKPLILAPAPGKQTWDNEAKVSFIDPNQVHIVKGSADLAAVSTSSKKYTVISHQLLEDIESDPELMRTLEKVVTDAGIDSGIVDEIDNFSNYSAISTRAALRLLYLIRQNYKARTGRNDAPIVGLTATPIKTGIEDMNVPMAMLYPDKYVASHRLATPDKKTFSDAHLNRPDLVYLSLVGEKLMYRWEQATGVQGFEYKPIHITASPFEELLHNYIYSKVKTGALNKIRLLEDSLLDPLLVKAEVRHLLGDEVPTLDVAEALDELKEIVAQWKTIKGVNEPESDDDFLSADKLVQLGKGDLVLACFFSDRLVKGVDSLIEEKEFDIDQGLLDLRKFWKSRELSSKYEVLKQLVQKSLTWQELPDGRVVRKKVMVISPSKRQGRTGDVLQRIWKELPDGTIIRSKNNVDNYTEEDIQEKSLYKEEELNRINDSKLITLIQSWVSGQVAKENILTIDGSPATAVGKKRDAIISRWVNDPEAAIMLVTLKATFQSRDYSLNNLIDFQGREIVGVQKIFLGPPWHSQQLTQMIGRDQRQGQLVPSENDILEVKGSIDQGKGEAVVYTWYLTRMALSGIVLTPQEQAFYDSKRVGKRIEYKTKEATFMRDSLFMMMGAGEEKLINLFASSQIDPERFSSEFFDAGKDEFHTTGYNAEFVSYLAKYHTPPNAKILCIGAGTLLLQRKMQIGIDNVDINPQIMEQGWEKAREFGGRMIQGRASSLDSEQIKDGEYDFADLAFTLHQSKLGARRVEDSERVKILEQVNRKLKLGGYFSFTTTEGSFDDEKFSKFAAAVEKHFGFSIVDDYSGKSYGIGQPRVRKRLGWSLFLKKTSDVNLEDLGLSDLEFLTDSRTWISQVEKEKTRVDIGIKNYPDPDLMLDLKEFEIVNPKRNSERVLISSTQASAYIPKSIEDETTIDLTLPDEPIVLRDSNMLVNLRGTGSQDFREYRTNLIKPIIKETGWTWEKVEEFCEQTLWQLSVQGLLAENKLAIFSQLIRQAGRNALLGSGVNN